jgi:hypothetical protein
VVAKRKLETPDEERELGQENFGDHNRFGLERDEKKEIPRPDNRAGP